MAAIYLSSTYSDLKDYREAVYKVLRQMGHHAVAMEDYVATDERPAAKCLVDVERADLYVGLFAWRYGYIPPDDNPDGRAITEMEYRYAKASGTACLIFLLRDDAPWSPKLMDMATGEGDRINTLRDALGQEHIVSFFSTADELAKLVSVAVQKWQETQASHAAMSGGVSVSETSRLATDFDHSARFARAAYRYARGPGDRGGNVGFRCSSSGREPRSGAEGKS